jgi:hypothetical protein
MRWRRWPGNTRAGKELAREEAPRRVRGRLRPPDTRRFLYDLAAAPMARRP